MAAPAVSWGKAGKRGVGGGGSCDIPKKIQGGGSNRRKICLFFTFKLTAPYKAFVF